MRRLLKRAAARITGKLLVMHAEEQRRADPRYRVAGIGSNVKLGSTTLGGKNSIGDYSTLDGDINLGYASTLGDGCALRGTIEVGRYSQFAPGVSLFARNHPVEHATIYVNRALLNGRMKAFQPHDPIVVGHDVWIGYGATVLAGVSIGDGAVVGAGSIVSSSVPDYTIVAGNPARKIKMRFDYKIIELFHRLRWWDLTVDQLAQFQDLFEVNLVREPDRATQLLEECVERRHRISNLPA